ncbi:EAL domain-containing protein [Campylobacter sp. RM12327]|uniref:sensor domain-containing phosphodiesterase n=1 Tax=Campylobacter sputorum TaxID=206 RepID=UPI001879D1D1|nr:MULTISPECIES: EAL domain-containing protein [unclassified Campylobacter]MBE7358454.1 EAL domain-containing protein [Campylobacter sp. RM11302]MBF6669371.1 EAL domain-containing protein [Campylobacter sp. RM12327]MBF6678262.1 EAL domain-containing protein [Campylobacter sp. RM11259]
MQNNSIKLQYLIMFLFILAVTFLTSNTIKEYKKLKYINNFLFNIQNLIYADKNIDINLKNINFYKKYDDIERLIFNFDTNLLIIKNIVKNKDTQTDKQVEIYNKIKENFLDKKETIRYYNGKMALIYSVMLDMQNYAQENNLSSDLNSIYSRFLNLNFDSYADIDTFLDYLVSINKQNLDKKELKFINRINDSIYNLIEANDYKFFILNSDLEKHLLNFFDYTTQQHKDIVDNLVKIFITMIIISLMFIFWNIKLLNNIKNKNKDISFLKLATDNSFNSIIFTNSKLNITYTNAAFEQISGYKLKDIIGKNPSFLKYYTQNKDYYKNFENAIDKKILWKKDNFISKTSDNKIIVEDIIVIPNINENKLEGFVSVKLDKTRELNTMQELNIKNQAFKRQIYKDHITNIGSYVALIEKLDNNEQGTIIYMRINNFSNLSYFYKSKIIDEFIISFVDTLKLCIKTYNINCEIFRSQLDEFCILYHGNNISLDITRIKSYFQTSNINITNNENTKINIQKIELILGISSNMDSNINRLTQAIWAYKKAKKMDEKIYFYQDNDPMEQQYFKNLDVIKLIQNALKNDKIIVECQPIFNIKTNSKIANKYEILIRILDDEGKIHYPSEFLNVAKQILLYNALTSKVIDITFNLLEKYPNKQFSINLSSSDMVNLSIRQTFIKNLKICKNPTNLFVEILENESIDNYDVINPFIKHIKEFGCKLSIDDFGSGYSNYYRMLEFDIDVLKIDGSIIKRLPFDKNSRIVMETIVSFAKKMNYEIVAEFVSDENILNEVKKYDVDYAQGFYLGKPISPDFILFN